jgi:endo-1,4-beta-mannosidase
MVPAGYRQETEPGQLVPYRAWAADVAERYGDDPTIACWQLMNEPASGPAGRTSGATLLRDFADDVADVVKRHAPRHLVSLGSIGTGQPGMSGGDYLTVHAGPAVDLCEVHDYSPGGTVLAGDRWNGLAVRLRQADKLGKPIFVAEFGNALGSTECATRQERAALYRRKLETFFAHGFVGALAWHWFRGDAFGLAPGIRPSPSCAPMAVAERVRQGSRRGSTNSTQHGQEDRRRSATPEARIELSG